MKRMYPKTPAEENPLMHTVNRLAPTEQKKAIFLDWLKTPPLKRVPRKPEVLAKNLGIELQVMDEWTTEVKVKELKVETYNSKKYFLSKQKEIDEGMVKAVGRGNAQMAKLIKQLTDELVEKQEVTHKGLSADDISRLTRKAKDDIGDFISGIREVPSQPDILSNEIRKN